MEDQNTESEKKKSSNVVFIIVISMLFCSNCVLGWLYFSETKTVEVKNVEISDLTIERTKLNADLNNMLQQYEDMKTSNDTLNEQLTEQQDRIRDLLKEAAKHKNDAYIIYKLKKESGTLREIMKGYLHTIDSLNTLNVNLTAEKQQISKELTTEKRKVDDLEKVREDLSDQVKIGARLRALGARTISQRVKKNGVHRETARASKVDKFKSCFTLDINELAKSGKRVIFMRVISPTAQILEGDNSGDMDISGVTGRYSASKEVNYENEELDICMYYEVINTLTAGEYIVELYCDGAQIGKSVVTLK